MKLIHKSISDTLILLVVGVVLVGLTSYQFISESTPAWATYQAEFTELVREKFGEETAEEVPAGIRQIWVEDIGLVDRCTTCHLGITWQGFEAAPNPYRTHPNMSILDAHPVKEYGCTTCHDGQGYAVDKNAAHGYVQHWEEPLLSKAIAGEYLIKSGSALIEMNCNVCHRYERETPGMRYVNHAKELIREKACKACHKINGSGGTIGPDLTTEGEKQPEGLDFSNFVGFKSVFNWHVNHFKNPIAIIPNTLMPDMNLSTYDAQALAILTMSWKDLDYPVEYLPGVELKEERTPEEIAQEKQLLEGEGAFFIEKGCFACHSISAWGIKSPTEKGPDLSYAVDDVRTRFGKTLEEFLFAPRGTMEMVLSSSIILTEEEKWDVIDKLRKAYKLKQEQLANEHQ